MKLFYVPWPFDYHQAGSIVVMAKSMAEAIKKAKRYYYDMANQYIDGEEQPEDWRKPPEYDKTTEILSGLFFNRGSDC